LTGEAGGGLDLLLTRWKLVASPCASAYAASGVRTTAMVRVVVRYERLALNYLSFVYLGCILILLRQG
jgi:hypothetical protein